MIRSDPEAGETGREQEAPDLSNPGAVAQLGERLNGIQEVKGSIPFSSTRHKRLRRID